MHLAIPEDILAAEIDVGTTSLHIEEACRVYPAHRPEVERVALQAFLDNIRAAQRPLLILGGGVNVSNAGAVATRVAEKLGMPVVTTITGQSAIPDTHPLSIGVIGDNGFHPHAMTALNEADLLIYVGSKIGSVVTIGWSFPRSAGQKTIQIDIDPDVLGNNTANIQSLCGDIRAIFERLERELTDTVPKTTSWVTALNAARQTFWDEVQSETPSAADPIRPLQVVQALNALLPAQAIVVADAGTPTPNLTRYLRLKADGSRLIIPRAYGGLGYAIPAVVGVWAANPAVKPIGIFGDGSFNMSCGELETLRRLKVPALLIHFNNACFGWIKALQRSHGHNQTFSVDFSADNIAKIAEAFGLKAWHVRRADELDAALAAGLGCDGPALIDVVVESIADISPPVFSWLKRAGRDPLSLSAGERVRVDQQA